MDQKCLEAFISILEFRSSFWSPLQTWFKIEIETHFPFQFKKSRVIKFFNDGKPITKNNFLSKTIFHKSSHDFFDFISNKNPKSCCLFA